MTYATLTQLKDALNITDTTQDSFLNGLLARVTQMIDTETQRTWQGPVTITDEEYDLPQNADGVFFLRHTDIQTFPTLKIGTPFNPTSFQTLTSGKDFVWNQFGRVILPNYSAGFQVTMFGGNQFSLGPVTAYGAFLASYTWGLSTPPRDIELACIAMASYMFTSRAGLRVTEEKIGDYTIQFDRSSKGVVETVAQIAGVQTILDSYKLRRV